MLASWVQRISEELHDFIIFDKNKKDQPKPAKDSAGARKERERWNSNKDFVIASIGSAIGIGNLWRFPYLCYKWGGAIFFIPYLLSLFLIGLPMMMLEFTLG